MLYGMAGDLAGRQMGSVEEAAAQGAQAASRPVDQALGTAGSMMGTGGMSAMYADPNNALARRQLAGATDDITSNLTRSILPNVRGAAGMSGGFGGSREALARGVAVGDASRAVAQAGTDIYSNQYQLGATMAGQADNNKITAAGMAPALAQSKMGLTMSPYSAAWSPLSSLAGALGAPTLLSSSSGISRALAGSENFSSSRSRQQSSQFGFNLF